MTSSKPRRFFLRLTWRIGPTYNLIPSDTEVFRKSFNNVWSAFVDLNMVGTHIDGVGSYGELNNCSLAVDITCLVEDEVADTVIDVMSMV